MTKLKDIRNWLFKNIVIDNKIDDIEHTGIQVRPPTDSKSIERLVKLENFSPNVRSNAVKALPVYIAFFCFENSVRELVKDRLTENYGSDWWSHCATRGIKDRVESRKEKEGKNRWHSQRGQHEIYYTDFGDLKSLIYNFYSDFEDLFPDRNWIVTRLEEMENSRNIIAHNNNLERREQDRIKLYLEDWIKQVG